MPRPSSGGGIHGKYQLGRHQRFAHDGSPHLVHFTAVRIPGACGILVQFICHVGLRTRSMRMFRGVDGSPPLRMDLEYVVG
jgi:hypothetical protein